MKSQSCIETQTFFYTKLRTRHIGIFITRRIKATLVSFTPVLGVFLMCFGATNYPKMKMFVDKCQNASKPHRR